jgi:hypothetical protein
MDARQRLGAVLVITGIGLVAVGGLGLAGRLGGAGTGSATTPSPTGLAAVSTSTAAAVSTSTPTAPPATPEPTLTPTQDPASLVTAFFARLQAAIRGGTEADLLGSLAPAVLDRYGRDACAADLADKDPVPGQVFEILAVHPPAPWDYVTDDRTTSVPDATTVGRSGHGAGRDRALQTTERELHVQIVGGVVLWFTDCGDPLSSP